MLCGGLRLHVFKICTSGGKLSGISFALALDSEALEKVLIMKAALKKKQVSFLIYNFQIFFQQV